MEIWRNAERDLWHLTLYGPDENQEMGGTSFDGADAGQLLALAREWAETPLSDRLPPREWQRLYRVAARTGKPARQLLQQGLREGVAALLDQLDADETAPSPT